MDLEIAGKVVLITGGSHGIGAATALEFAREGCQVVICARDKEKIDQTINEIQSFGVKALGIAADVLRPDAAFMVVNETIKNFGTIHILVNNVGGGGRWGGENILDTEEKVWYEVFQKNTMAAIQFTRETLPYMIKQKWGRVVSVASIYGKEAGGKPWFNLAKSAEISFMKTMAMDAKIVRKNITFNSVAPGALMIAGTGWEEEKNKNPKRFDARLNANFPLGRMGTPEEVARVIVFICSKSASYVNGACIAVDGGESRSF
jgi:3-oxoacyl-[acyl-carrier protein] reductase